MKKTNYFRIELLDGANTLCQSIVVMAAKSNGGEKNYTLAQMKTVADGETLLYPSLNDDITCELIGDTILHIDRKIGNEYKTVCRIEEIEILGKVVEFETEDDLEGIFN